MAQLLAALLLELIVVSSLVVIALNRPDPKWKYLILFFCIFDLSYFVVSAGLKHWLGGAPRLRFNRSAY